MQRVSLLKVFLVVVGFAGLLAVNQLWLAPSLIAAGSETLGQGAYVFLRVGALILLSLTLTVYARAERFRALSLTTFVAFLDGVVLSGFQVYRQIQLSPPGTVPEGAVTGALFGLGMSFILFFPILLIFAFAGTELGKLWLERRAKKGGDGLPTSSPAGT